MDYPAGRQSGCLYFCLYPERIAASENGGNRLVDIEDLTEKEILILKNFYIELADKAEKELDLHSLHSLDAEDNYNLKLKKVRKKVEVK